MVRLGSVRLGQLDRVYKSKLPLFFTTSEGNHHDVTVLRLLKLESGVPGLNGRGGRDGGHDFAARWRDVARGDGGKDPDVTETRTPASATVGVGVAHGVGVGLSVAQAAESF